MSSRVPTSSFQELWPQGFNALREALVDAGFSDLEWESTEQHAEAFARIKPETLQHSYLSGAESGSSIKSSSDSLWGFLGPESRNAWPKQAAMLFVHPDRRSDVPEDFEGELFWTQWPEAALDWILCKVWPELHAGPVSEESFQVHPSTIIENNVSIGPGSEVSEDCVIESGVRIGARVTIGRGCRIGANVSILDDTVIGDYCKIGSSSSIGGRGLGTIPFPPSTEGGKSLKQVRKHVGRVRLGSFVDLGSNVGVDRAVFGETRLDDHVLADNHVQIAHNCTVGEGSILCAFVGLAGSTHVGRNCVIAGAVGTNGHLKIGDNVTVGGQSGVTIDVAPNQMVKGYPPRPIREALRIENLKTRLPELYSRLKALEKAVGIKR